MTWTNTPRRLVILGLAAIVLAAGYATFDSLQAADGDLVFSDVKAQTAEFMGYYKSIRLTPEQEAVKKEALTALPAPCCSDNTAYTCCCPCNMSLTIWGLSNYLIAEKGYSAEALKAKVEEWIAFINPEGFSGVVCYRGQCGRSFKNGGCGGMNPNHVVWD